VRRPCTAEMLTLMPARTLGCAGRQAGRGRASDFGQAVAGRPGGGAGRQPQGRGRAPGRRRAVPGGHPPHRAAALRPGRQGPCSKLLRRHDTTCPQLGKQHLGPCRSCSRPFARLLARRTGLHAAVWLLPLTMRTCKRCEQGRRPASQSRMRSAGNTRSAALGGRQPIV